MCVETLKYVFIPVFFGVIFCYDPPLPVYYPATYYVRPRLPASRLGYVSPLNLGQSYLQTPLLCFGRPGCNLFTPRNFAGSNSTIPKAEDLFTPASIRYPAESRTQLEAYRKAMEEEAKEEAGKISGTETTEIGVAESDARAVTYVNVMLGGDKNINYQYSV